MQSSLGYASPIPRRNLAMYNKNGNPIPIEEVVNLNPQTIQMIDGDPNTVPKSIYIADEDYSSLKDNPQKVNYVHSGYVYYLGMEPYLKHYVSPKCSL